MSRDLDLVVFGATGFTGQLVAEYLVQKGLGGLKLGLGGRNESKLQRVRSELAAIDPAAADLPLLVGDSADPDAMNEIARRARVVCTTVGPYAKYGEAMVGACAQHGTHYCDLTGEAHFIARMMELHHETAMQSGARIVHCCGFDSIPSDLGTYMLHDAFASRGGQVERVRLFVGEMRGALSGGTIATMFNAIEDGTTDRKARRALGDPYSLYPEGEPRGQDGSDQRDIRYDADLGMWTAPFVMASINTRVVRRSNALLDFAYGRDFRYAEATSTGRGPKGLMRATVMMGGLTAFTLGALMKPTRELIKTRLPSPGEGPSKQKREAGYFVMRLIADGKDDNGSRLRLFGKVKGTADPGYGETAKMLGESALCLAQDSLESPGGIRTPASTMATPLLNRLRAAGMTFDVVDRL